jgi:hypothetical protein
MVERMVLGDLAAFQMRLKAGSAAFPPAPHRGRRFAQWTGKIQRGLNVAHNCLLLLDGHEEAEGCPTLTNRRSASAFSSIRVILIFTLS